MPLSCAIFASSFHVLDVCATDVGIEKHGIAVAVLTFDEIIEIRAHVLERFGQTGLFLNGVYGEIDGRDFQRRPVGRLLSGPAEGARSWRGRPRKSFFCRVVNDSMNKVGAQERLATSGLQARGNGVDSSQSIARAGRCLRSCLSPDCHRTSSNDNRDCISIR